MICLEASEMEEGGGGKGRRGGGRREVKAWGDNLCVEVRTPRKVFALSSVYVVYICIYIYYTYTYPTFSDFVNPDDCIRKITSKSIRLKSVFNQKKI